jgi:hypothetical protein
MAWTEEISEAAYTSPSGKRIVFNYEPGVEKSTSLKTSENVFPDLDGAEIQSLGLGGRKFPMTAIFSGENCIKDADEFEEILCERGYGELEHPVYGKHVVVPTGDIGRSDNLVSGANESKVKITFSETISDRTFPDSDISAVDTLDQAMESYEEAAVSSFLEMVEIDSIEDEIQLQNTLEVQSDTLFKGVEKIAEKSNDLQEKQELLQELQNMKDSVSNWTSKIDTISPNLENIARTLIQAVRLPSKIIIGALAKIEAYASIIKDLINNVKKDPVGLNAIANQFAATSSMVGALVASLGFGAAYTAFLGSVSGSSSGSSSKSLAGGFKSRSDVLSISSSIRSYFEDYVSYMDSQTDKNAFVDTGESYSALLETVVASIQVLEAVSFSLSSTRTLTLSEDRQLLELLTELYGKDGFDKVDEFITDNALTANEIAIIPMGREVRYYG